MHPESTIQPMQTPPKPAPPSAYYCSCAIPLAVERAERRGAAYRACARCGLPLAVRWSRW
jgi:hypothetical protein